MTDQLEGVQIHSSTAAAAQDLVLTPEALAFIAALHRQFETTRQRLLSSRIRRQKELDSGVTLDFLVETAAVREDTTWRGATPAPGLEDRRVEITGPTDAKLVVNALNSGSNAFMADFEGMSAPHLMSVVMKLSMFVHKTRTLPRFPTCSKGNLTSTMPFVGKSTLRLAASPTSWWTSQRFCWYGELP
jgi:malate synthase